jgi:HSP20 family protein
MFSLTPTRKNARTLAALNYGPLEVLRREFAPLFERAFAGFPMPFETPWEMPIPWDVVTEDAGKELVVRAELPGFEMNEIEVTLMGNLLNIVAEHKEEPKKEKAEPVERHWNAVRRTVMLPEGAKVEGITALYRNGILEVHVPKAPEVLPRRVEVKT